MIFEKLVYNINLLRKNIYEKVYKDTKVHKS